MDQTVRHAHQSTDTNYLSIFTTHFFSLPAKNSDLLRNLYIENGLTAHTIAKFSDDEWSRTAIVMALQSLGLQKKNRLTSHTKYGEKIVGGQRLPHLGEQKNIQKMIKLRNKGNSLRQVALILNPQGTTNRSGGNWDKTVIGTIIKRELQEE